MKHEIFYLPSSLNLEALLPTTELPNLPYYAFFVHSLLCRSSIDRRQCESSWVPLSAKVLLRVIPKRRYAAIKKNLLSLGVIETNRSYVVGERATGYRLGIAYASDLVVKRSFRLPGKVSRSLALLEAPGKTRRSWLDKQLQSHMDGLCIDSAAAKKIVLGWPRGTEEQVRSILSAQVTICRFEDGRLFIHPPDTFGHRRHSPLTSLPRELRNCLTYTGSHLVEIDISNSQPFFLASILKTSTVTIETSLLNRVTHTTLIPYDVHFTLSADYGRYCDLVTQGRLYEDMQSSLGIGTRGEAKEAFFTVLFGKVQCRCSPRERWFRDAFPSVHAACRAIKGGHYKLLCGVLQRRESSFIFDRVCSRLFRECPNIPIWTIHDSILTIPEHEETVQNALLGEARDYLGLQPKLSIKRLGPSAFCELEGTNVLEGDRARGESEVIEGLRLVF